MPTWNSRGLRGSALEEIINRTNEKYLEQKLGLIQKIPTPITPVKINEETRQINALIISGALNSFSIIFLPYFIPKIWQRYRFQRTVHG